ncbi:MAG: phosphoglycerate kinase [Rhodospirillales bacterium]|jgi:phosphoglycerate kinase|nr:phosphoglycerate kinase [Rhodospirillales bacterium]HIJ44133.1 phosphoglycerate kinase [Rhodospirillaceae bacterium]MDP7215127.1 phosphoglycerate kinase [Rhodospirillales bacterium]HIJ45958.1 phosphoglycerate kinase [Rhodospirillaceae bacterium]HIJ93917.1 phosphoglycerate kinase [Rhodospirillaceae bacterium]
MNKVRTIDDLQVAGKRVLVRADLNTPMDKGRVTDSTRLDRTAPTLIELADKGARVIVMSHFGRPKGRVVDELSLRPVAAALSAALGRPVAFATDSIGAEAKKTVAAMKDGDIASLENLRFHAGETENNLAFAEKLAAHGDAYVNDAFSCAHRAHASTEAVARLLPAAAGRLMQEELVALGNALEAPRRPLAAVVGGAKVSTKMEVLGNLTGKVDLLIIGGGMANTFLHAQGVNVGKSLCEKEMADSALEIMAAAAAGGCEIILPRDAVVAREFKTGAASETVPVDAIPIDAMMLDVGPASVAEVSARLEECKTLVWNGPFGAFEIPPFDAGTNAVAQAAARLTKNGTLLTVAGGGDTVAALVHAGVAGDFSYVSTAGGAFLEWLEGRSLPGVAVLQTV